MEVPEGALSEAAAPLAFATFPRERRWRIGATTGRGGSIRKSDGEPTWPAASRTARRGCCPPGAGGYGLSQPADLARLPPARAVLIFRRSSSAVQDVTGGGPGRAGGVREPTAPTRRPRRGLEEAAQGGQEGRFDRERRSSSGCSWAEAGTTDDRLHPVAGAAVYLGLDTGCSAVQRRSCKSAQI